MFRTLFIPSVLLLSACAGTSSGPTGSVDSTVDSATPDSSSKVIHAPDSQCVPTTQQLVMLDAVNEFRASTQTCGGQSMPAVASLQWNCALANAANVHSEDMARYGFLNHTGSDGLLLEGRLEAQQYNAGVWAENIAEGYDSVESVVAGFASSDGHCKNMMNDKVTEFGAAAAISSQGRPYWTQVFAKPF